MKRFALALWLVATASFADSPFAITPDPHVKVEQSFQNLVEGIETQVQGSLDYQMLIAQIDPLVADGYGTSLAPTVLARVARPNKVGDVVFDYAPVIDLAGLGSSGELVVQRNYEKTLATDRRGKQIRQINFQIHVSFKTVPETGERRFEIRRVSYHAYEYRRTFQGNSSSI